jgi:apoptosis-inducing factor 2
MTNSPTVVVVGGGYGGITAAKALDQAADVILVDPKDAFFHNIAALRALVAPDWLERIFFPYERLLAHGRFVRDRAIAVEAGRVALASGATLTCDYIVLATGSSYPFPAKTGALDSDESRARHRAAHDALSHAERALLLGAGPVGIELAGEIKAAYPGKHVTILDVADEILAGPYDPRIRVELRRQLAELGVELRLGTRLREEPASAPATLAPITATTEAGDAIAADVWYRCHGVSAATDYLADALASTRGVGGRIEVTEHLRVPGCDTVFAIGDIATGDRPMGGRAMMQAALVADNILALTNGDPLTAYEPRPPAIFVPLGPEGGAGQMPGTDEIAGPQTVAEIKGRHMMIDRFAEMFSATAAENR